MCVCVCCVEPYLPHVTYVKWMELIKLWHHILHIEFFVLSHLHPHGLAQIKCSEAPDFLHHNNRKPKQSSQFNMIMVEKGKNLATTLHCFNISKEAKRGFFVDEFIPYRIFFFRFKQEAWKMMNIIGNNALCLLKMIKNSMNSYSMVWWRWTCIVSAKKNYFSY